MLSSKLRKKKGIFITLEGIDGSGKTTQIKLLKNYFEKNKKEKIIFTREPGGTHFSEKLRKLILNKNHNSIKTETKLLLLLAARNEHCLNVIKPSLNNGCTVVCDRFTDSTYAYQCNGNNRLNKIYKNLNSLILNKFEPNLTILLDIDPKISLYRISKRRNNNDYDKKSLLYYKKARNVYINLAKINNRIVVIDAKKPSKDIFDIVKNEVLKKINVR